MSAWKTLDDRYPKQEATPENAPRSVTPHSAGDWLLGAVLVVVGIVSYVAYRKHLEPETFSAIAFVILTVAILIDSRINRTSATAAVSATLQDNEKTRVYDRENLS